MLLQKKIFCYNFLYLQIGNLQKHIDITTTHDRGVLGRCYRPRRQASNTAFERARERQREREREKEKEKEKKEGNETEETKREREKQREKEGKKERMSTSDRASERASERTGPSEKEKERMREREREREREDRFSDSSSCSSLPAPSSLPSSIFHYQSFYFPLSTTLDTVRITVILCWVWLLNLCWEIDGGYALDAYVAFLFLRKRTLVK